MTIRIPITLKGPNLGERHRHLNSLVIEAYNAGEPFESIVMLTESSPVDRLFKIDLASKHKHVEYILKCLQDDDMLYVSRALKSKWLLDEEYRHIISPASLQDSLYPQMITTAVTKIKHWIHLNMRDTARCQEFYEYYLEKDSDYAFKFLLKCSENIILKEFPKKVILDKITPHRFKMLCEKSPSVAKTYFQMLQKDKPLLEKYIANDIKYLDSVKCILKTDADEYWDIIEQHFLPHFKKLSKQSTKYLLTHHKERFVLKAELYTARILNIDVLAQCLTQDESEELLIRLAQAQYLESKEYWFNYKNVEPLIKRLDVKKRASLKKKVFVDKDIGDIVTDWPYACPKSLFDLMENDSVDIFIDEEASGNYDEDSEMDDCIKCCMAPIGLSYKCGAMPKPKTALELLFDEYRFMNFEKTLFELRKKIKSESSSQNRMYMMLVLVSKSGGKTESLDALFHLLMEHLNEPCQVRAAVIRSLVKRAFVWRVSDDIWEKLLVFGRDLGLDGNTPDSDCDEGLHAVVIRTLLSNQQCSLAIKTAYIRKFSTLTSYSLTVAEKRHIDKTLLNMLLESSNAEVNAHDAAQILEHAFNTLQAYHLKFENHPEIITCIKKLVEKDQTEAIKILKCLFDSKLGRKELFYENFNIIQTDASYLNALKHDISVLSIDKLLKALESNNLTAEQFIRKISIYFNQNQDLGSKFLTALRGAKVHKKLARPLAYLIRENLKSYILELDVSDLEVKRYSAVIRAHAHVARPPFGIDSLDWRESGAKLIANRVLKCRSVDVDHLIKRLLSWKRTAKLAIVLSVRTNYGSDVFETVAKVRPTVALKTGLKYFRQKGENSDFRIWEIVKPLIAKRKDSIKSNGHLLRNMKKIESMPLTIRPDYATEIFKVINDTDSKKSAGVIGQIMVLLPNIGESFIEEVLRSFIENRFNAMIKDVDNYQSIETVHLYLKIFIKFILLSKTNEIQNKRLEEVAQLYLARLQSYWESSKKKRTFFICLNVIINSLKYHEAFLNENYVSSLPVMEYILEWMKKFLPMEEYFNSYVPLHLNMLYYKAVRQAVKQNPDIFVDKQKRRNEGYKIVGEYFGKYIGHEAQVLIKKYYESIVMLYNEGLVDYFRCFNSARFLLVPYVIKGIVDVAEGVEYASAVGIWNDNIDYLNDDKQKEIIKYLGQKNQNVIQFYFNNWVRRPHV